MSNFAHTQLLTSKPTKKKKKKTFQKELEIIKFF